MREIRTDITIEGTAEDVWRVLMDFDSYPEWNPFIRSIEGSTSNGEKITAVLGATGKRPFTISPTIQEHDAPSRFAWLGSIGTKGVFDGHHQFELAESRTNTHFLHYEEFSGILAPLIAPLIRSSTERGFNEMNEALKIRVERRS